KRTGVPRRWRGGERGLPGGARAGECRLRHGIPPAARRRRAGDAGLDAGRPRVPPDRGAGLLEADRGRPVGIPRRARSRAPGAGRLRVRIQAHAAPSAAVLHGDCGGTPVGALCGSASDLLLVLWRRLPLDAVTVDGDPAAVAAQIAATELV